MEIVLKQLHFASDLLAIGLRVEATDALHLLLDLPPQPLLDQLLRVLEPNRTHFGHIFNILVQSGLCILDLHDSVC